MTRVRGCRQDGGSRSGDALVASTVTLPESEPVWSAPPTPPVAVPRREVASPQTGERVVAVIAPAGYGKTTLAAQWFDELHPGIEARWFALDSSWVDPAYFTDSLVEALTGERHVPAEGPHDGVAAVELRLGIALEALRNRTRRVLLYFDDIHTIAGSQTAMVLSRLLLAAPRNVGFVLTGRDAEGFGLSRLAMTGEVRWVSERQLVLSPQEVRDVARRRQIHLSEGGLERIIGLSEGWPAMVQLALCGVNEDGEGLPSSGTLLPSLHNLAYEGFFGSLLPTDRQALGVMAALPDFTASLLGALDCPDSAKAIANCERLGLVQRRPNGTGHDVVYALHPLLAEETLKRSGSGEDALIATRLRASRWWRGVGDAERAIALALLSGNGEDALHCLQEHAPVLVESLGRHETFLRLLEQVRRRVAQVGTPLELLAAWSLIFLRRYALAEQALARLEAQVKAIGDERDPAVGHTLLLQHAVLAGLRDHHESAGRYAQRWLEESNDTDGYRRGTAFTVLAFSQKCTGLFGSARRSLERAREEFEAARSSFGSRWVCVVSALTQVKAGAYRAALSEASAGLAQIAEANDSQDGLAAMLHAVRGQVLYERDQCAEARAEIELALPLLEHQGIVDALVACYVTAARLQAARGDLSAALDALAEGERVGSSRGFERLRLTLVAERALQLLRGGNAWGARQIMEQEELSEANQELGVKRDKAERIGARYELAQGRAARTLYLVEPAIERARSSGQLHKLAELLLLRSLAAQELHELRVRDTALDESLSIAAAQGYVRLYIDEGKSALDLVRAALEGAALSAASSSHARHVLERGAKASGDRETDDELARPTDREIQILSLIAEGHSNADLAARVFLAEGTVKWHLHNLYRKLDVSNRTGALRAARARGWLRD